MGKGDVYKDIVTTINDFLRDSAVLTSWVTSWKSYSPGPGGHLPAPAAPQLLLLRAPGRGSELRPSRRRKWGHVSINHGLASRPCPVCRKVVIQESRTRHTRSQTPSEQSGTCGGSHPRACWFHRRGARSVARRSPRRMWAATAFILHLIFFPDSVSSTSYASSSVEWCPESDFKGLRSLAHILRKAGLAPGYCSTNYLLGGGGWGWGWKKASPQLLTKVKSLLQSSLDWLISSSL